MDVTVTGVAAGVLGTLAMDSLNHLVVVYPSMGFGVLGRRSPEGISSALSSLASHLFFGVGMAAAVALL